MQNKVATIGLVAFLAVDVALVALALRPGRPAETGAAGTPTTSVTVPSETESTQSGTSTATRTPSSAATGTAPSSGPKPAPVTQIVGALDATTAWRAVTGACQQGGAALSVTIDGGKSWEKTTTPAVRAIARVQPLDQDRVFVLAAGAGCVLRQYASNDRGDTWPSASGTSGGWARQLDDSTEVLTPQDDRAQPCGPSTDVIDLSRTSVSQAQALCADGDVKVTNDGGEGWADSGAVVGGLALGNRIEDDRLATYVARVGGSCAGIQVVRVAKGRSLENVACVGSRVPSKAGQVALSVVEGAGWMAVGDQVWTAPADLTTWKQP